MALAEATDNKPVVLELEKLAGDGYQQNIVAKKVSVLELLERYPSIAFPISSYLAMLPPMRVRQ